MEQCLSNSLELTFSEKVPFSLRVAASTITQAMLNDNELIKACEGSASRLLAYKFRNHRLRFLVLSGDQVPKFELRVYYFRPASLKAAIKKIAHGNIVRRKTHVVRKLKRLGIDCVPVLHTHQLHLNGHHCGCYSVIRYLPEVQSLKEFLGRNADNLSADSPFLHSLSSFLWRLFTLGVWQRQLSGGHILIITRRDEPLCKFMLADLEHIRLMPISVPAYLRRRSLLYLGKRLRKHLGDNRRPVQYLYQCYAHYDPAVGRRLLSELE